MQEAQNWALEDAKLTKKRILINKRRKPSRGTNDDSLIAGFEAYNNVKSSVWDNIRRVIKLKRVWIYPLNVRLPI